MPGLSGMEAGNDFLVLHQMPSLVRLRAEQVGLSLLPDIGAIEREWREGMNWQPIEAYPKNDRKMRVVKAFAMPYGPSHAELTYNTDPYCVWYQDGVFVRWPHSFPPTHYCEVPEDIK